MCVDSHFKQNKNGKSVIAQCGSAISHRHFQQVSHRFTCNTCTIPKLRLDVQVRLNTTFFLSPENFPNSQNKLRLQLMFTTIHIRIQPRAISYRKMTLKANALFCTVIPHYWMQLDFLTALMQHNGGRCWAVMFQSVLFAIL